MAALRRYDLVKAKGRWVARSRGRRQRDLGKVRKYAIIKAAELARRQPGGATVRIHSCVDGQIVEERTYPRAADSRRAG